MRIILFFSILFIPWICADNGCFLNPDENVGEALERCEKNHSFIEAKDHTLDLSNITQSQLEIAQKMNLRAPAIKIVDTSFTHIALGYIQTDDLYIQGNRFLKELSISKSGRFENTIGRNKFNVRISGNPRLNISDSLRAVLDSNLQRESTFTHLQELGECEFVDKVKNVNELDDCKYVFGNLKMQDTIGSHVKTRLLNISECLSIINTELEDIDFLEGTTFGKCEYRQSIRENKKLWIHPKRRRELSALHIQMHEDDAVGKCTPQEAISEEFECTFVDGNLIIAGNSPHHNIERIKMVKGTITVQDTSLETLDFENLVNISTVGSIDPVLSFINNSELTSILLPKLKNVEIKGEKFAFFLKENPKLLNLESLRKDYMELNYVERNITEWPESNFTDFDNATLNSTDVYGLNFTEPNITTIREYFGKEVEIRCDFGTEEIVSLTQIYGCNSIIGDLLLTNTTGINSTEITSISGCLRITNTELTDISFLNLTSSQPSSCTSGLVITGNQNLCLRWSEAKELGKIFGRNLTYEPNSECAMPCTQEEYDGRYCNEIDGNLTVTGQNPNNIDFRLSYIMYAVKKIRGALVVFGNSDVEMEFLFLEAIGSLPPNVDRYSDDAKNGKEDHTDNIEPGILIYDNQNLKGFSTPKLKSIRPYLYPFVRVTGYIMGAEQAKILRNAVGGHRRLELECDFGSQPVTETSHLVNCEWVKGDLILSGSGVDYFSHEIHEVTGCIQVLNTEMNNVDLQRIAHKYNQQCVSGGRSRIVGNKNFCPEWQYMPYLLHTAEISLHESCPLSCSIQEFQDPNSWCKTFKGDLVINGGTDAQQMASVFNRVERVTGIIHIEGTNFGEITFSKLTHIDNYRETSPHYYHYNEQPKEYALVIVNNHALRNFNLPNIQNIGGPIQLLHNNGYRISGDTSVQMNRAVQSGGYALHYACAQPEFTDFSQMEGCPQFIDTFVIRGTIGGTPPSRPVEPLGCLQIEKSSVTSLDFITFTENSGSRCQGESYVRDNPNLCIHPGALENLKKYFKLGDPTGNKPRDQCPLTCYTENGNLPYEDCDFVKNGLAIGGDCSPKGKYNLIQTIDGGMVISGCSVNSWKTLLPRLSSINSDKWFCLLLENVDGYTNVTDLIDLKMTSGNPSQVLMQITTVQPVPYMDAAYLKYHFGAGKVEVTNVSPMAEGVCVFPNPAVDVKDCKTVEGDLVLNENTVSVAPGITEVTGCLILTKTRMEDYEFLTTVEKVGEKCRWNDKVTDFTETSCIPHTVRKKTSGKVAELVEKKENWKNCYECIGGLKPGQICNVIVGDLEINQNFNEQMETQLEEIQVIQGRLIVKNSVLSHVVLKNLTSIEAPESEGPPIEIVGNEKLLSIEIPSLAKVTSKSTQIVRIAENAMLVKSDELMEKLVNLTGTECGEKDGGACQFSQVKGAVERARDAKKAEKGEKKEEESSGGYGAAAAAVIVISLIFIIGGGVSVGVGVFLLKRGSKKGAKDTKTGKSKAPNGKGKPPAAVPKKGAKTTTTASKADEKATKTASERKKSAGTPVNEKPKDVPKQGDA